MSPCVTYLKDKKYVYLNCFIYYTEMQVGLNGFTIAQGKLITSANVNGTGRNMGPISI